MRSSIALALTAAVAAQQCQNITIPVTISANNSVINDQAPYPNNQSEVTTFIAKFLQIPQPSSSRFINGSFINNATYNITATYCQSTASNATNSTKPLQILIHGIGFDKGYWDFTNATSYTTPMRAAGYDTLAIDRLGCGFSSKPDGRLQVQTATHVEIVRQITMAAKNGSLPSVNKTYARTVHVGHSYGSIITNGLVGKYPNATDGIVLTGYSVNSTWVPQTFSAFSPRIAAVDVPSRFNTSTSRLNNTYLTWADIYNNQLAFFYGGYNQSVLQLDEQRKQPVTYGEIITLGQGSVPSNFTGPVQVVTGADDFIFCGGDCLATNGTNLTSIPAQVTALFPAASNFSTYLPANTGHAVQLHNSNMNATLEILSFLKANGL